ncbi:MAG: hypothetical protein U9N33_02775 [Campylobacterota bacterium]|nr:hypothetical protein [Campylobacterota bacterium]
MSKIDLYRGDRLEVKDDKKQHIVCFSGGHSSAIVAIEVVRKYGKENVILLNHDISSNVENADIKRFKNEVANYLSIEITYANMKGFEENDQFDVCIKAKAFKVSHDRVICTSRLKTEPFTKYLNKHQQDKNCIIYYGFDKREDNRINRRTVIMEKMGYQTEYPLSSFSVGIKNTTEIGINPPMTYSHFRHANCTGCIKGGSQHWYIVFCTRKDLWEKGKEAERIIKHSIIKNNFLIHLECKFKLMQELEIEPTEHIAHQTFWANVRKKIRDTKLEELASYDKECLCT